MRDTEFERLTEIPQSEVKTSVEPPIVYFTWCCETDVFNNANVNHAVIQNVLDYAFRNVLIQLNMSPKFSSHIKRIPCRTLSSNSTKTNRLEE